jgi:hypothetical protein
VRLPLTPQPAKNKHQNQRDQAARMSLHIASLTLH